MKKMLTENIWLKLISIVLAAILWVLILYTYDPAATADFNLNVNIINGDTITSLGKVYEVIEGRTVTIRVKANSSLVKTLRSTDFEATADVSKLSPTSHANIDVVCTKANNVDIRLIGTVKFLEVKLEDLTSKQFPITVEKRGEAEEGFFVGNAVPKPNFITVSGGKSTVNRIKTVRVRVDAKGSHTGFTEKAEPKAYDIDGNEITTGSLSFSEPSVSVALNIYKTKTIPIVIKTVGQPYIGYGIESINYEPKLINIAGDNDKLAKFRSIILPVEVDGAITSVESSVRLIDYVSDGVYLVDPETVVNINTKVVRHSTKDILLSLENINLKNQSEDFTYEPLSELPLKISFKGLKADLEKLSPEKLAAEIDFAEATEVGEYRLEVKVKEIEGVSLPSKLSLDFLVKEKAEEADTQEETTDNEVEDSENPSSEEPSSTEGESEEETPANETTEGNER